MGNNNDINQKSNEIIYSVPRDYSNLSDQEEKHEIVYRNPISQKQLNDKSSQQVNSLHDIILMSFNKFKSNNCLTYVEKNEQLSLNYAQVLEKVQMVGSEIESQGLLSEISHYETTIYTVGLWARNRYEWLILDIASMIYNFSLVPIPCDIETFELEYILKQTEIKTIFCEKEFLASLLEIEEDTNLKNVISLDEIYGETQIQQIRDLELKYNFMSYQGLLKQSLKNNKQNYIKPTCDEVYSLCFTKDSLGMPLASVISHRNVISCLAGIQHTTFLIINQTDIYMPHLPLYHIYERLCCLYILVGGGSLIFSSDDLTNFQNLLINMQKFSPTIFCSVPYIYNKIYELIDQKIQNQGNIQKDLTQYALEQKTEKYRTSGDNQNIIYDILFTNIKSQLGNNLRLAITSGASIYQNRLEKMKIVLGIPIISIYGLTECTGPVFSTHYKEKRSNVVGGPFSNLEFKLSNSYDKSLIDSPNSKIGIIRGEIWIRGSNVFLGYLNNEEETAKVLNQNDGWFKTGDIGQLNLDGSIEIIDTIKDNFKTSRGEYVSPIKLENIFKSPIIKDIFIVGDSFQDYLIAIIHPEQNIVQNLAMQNNFQDDFNTLCQIQAINNIFLSAFDHIFQTNNLKSYEFIKKIHLSPVSFNDLNLYDTNNNLKRQEAKQKFKQVIQKLYEFD